MQHIWTALQQDGSNHLGLWLNKVRAEAPTTSAGASSGEATVDDEVVGDMVQVSERARERESEHTAFPRASAAGLPKTDALCVRRCSP